MENNVKIDQIIDVLNDNVDGHDISAFCLIAGPNRKVAFITGDKEKIVSSLANVMREKKISRLMRDASERALKEILKDEGYES